MYSCMYVIHTIYVCICVCIMYIVYIYIYIYYIHKLSVAMAACYSVNQKHIFSNS